MDDKKDTFCVGMKHNRTEAQESQNIIAGDNGDWFRVDGDIDDFIFYYDHSPQVSER